MASENGLTRFRFMCNAAPRKTWTLNRLFPTAGATRNCTQHRAYTERARSVRARLATTSARPEHGRSAEAPAARDRPRGRGAGRLGSGAKPPPQRIVSSLARRVTRCVASDSKGPTGYRVFRTCTWCVCSVFPHRRGLLPLLRRRHRATRGGTQHRDKVEQKRIQPQVRVHAGEVQPSFPW